MDFLVFPENEQYGEQQEQVENNENAINVH